jgi:hypothetical protein
MSNRGQLYGYADVGRFGLGHGLLAWGRCVVWCHQNNAPVIAPQWLRLRIGPYLRRERDKRFYARLFQTGSQIGGIKRLSLLAAAPRLSAESQRPAPGWQPLRDSVVVFTNSPAQNESKFFHEIVGHSAVVRAALIDMTRPRFRPAAVKTLAGQPAPHIAVHVRGGDFSTPSDVATLKSGGHNQRLPLSWYVKMLGMLRDGLAYAGGPALITVVYSDCSDAELAPLLSMPNVRRSTYAAAVSDMLGMAEATVLISSGSGFSRWGSYLGQVPRLCFPGQRAVRTLGAVTGSVDLEPECEEAGDFDPAFLAAVRHRIDIANTSALG